MSRKWLNFINLGIVCSAVVLLAAAAYFRLARPDTIPLRKAQAAHYPLPRHAFKQKESAYVAIGQPLLSLNYVAPKMQLPDLRNTLVYYGQNGRPDATSEHPLLHMGLSGKETAFAVMDMGDKTYLIYGKEGHYLFSPDNRETSLWFETEQKGDDLAIRVCMVDENGEPVNTPASHASFTLKEREYARVNGLNNKGWELGQWRVDGTLLARQRARWFGIDRFIEKHGGNEYREHIGKQRIDFSDQEENYSVYLEVGDLLAWDGKRWEEVESGAESRGRPLLVTKKVDERLINFELWDIDGRRKVSLNLLKSMETWMPNNFQDEFRFLGARTRSQYVFAVDDEKMLLRPDDWLLLTNDGWKKLNTIEEIDDYVERKETGVLFVFEGMAKNDDQQMLRGTIFNPTRTESHELDLPVQKESFVYRNTVPSRRYAQTKEQKKIPRTIASSSYDGAMPHSAS